MTVELLPLVSSCLTSREAWEKLATELSSTSESRIIEFTSRFHSLKKGAESLDDYISEFREFLAELTNADEQVAERIVNFMFFRGFGSKFCSFRTGVTTWNENLLFDDLLAALRYEVSLDNFGSDDQVMDAHVAPMANRVQACYRTRPRIMPNNTTLIENVVAPMAIVVGRAKDVGGRNGRFRPHCQLCLKQGHRAPKCRSASYQHMHSLNPLSTPMNRPPMPSFGGPSHAYASTFAGSVDPSFFPLSAPCVHPSHHQAWYPDSGATLPLMLKACMEPYPSKDWSNFILVMAQDCMTRELLLTGNSFLLHQTFASKFIFGGTTVVRRLAPSTQTSRF
ncbi:uncharacterized protein LOC144700263 [Wolffia australiana]